MATNEEKQNSYHNSLLVDIDEMSLRPLPPICGYEKLPIGSLEEAVEPLTRFLPEIQHHAYLAKQGAGKSPDNLTVDESAAITLYTMDWEPHNECLHVALNSVLWSEQRQNLEPWFPYLKLFVTALYRLPPISHDVVFRGSKLDLRNSYQIGAQVTWKGFSLSTSSIKDLESTDLLGTTGPRTLFFIRCHSGRDIQTYSSNTPKNEIIIYPGTSFRVVGQFNPASDIFIVQLEEIQPSYPLLDASACSAALQTHASTCQIPVIHPTVIRARGFEETVIENDYSTDGTNTKQC